MAQLSNFVVAKSNALIQASHKLNLNEQRLVLACVAQMDGRRPMPKDNLFTIYPADGHQPGGKRLFFAGFAAGALPARW